MPRLFPTMVSLLKRLGYQLSQEPGKLNIVGVRGLLRRSNRFDDELHVFYATSQAAAKWNYHVYACTTDPGTYWLSTPSNPLGTAILAPGQYVDTYAIGLHKGQYAALIQSKPVTVIRDGDRDASLDLRSGKRQTGNFGINIHRAAAQGKTTRVGEWSAGCTVLADPDAFAELMVLAQNHRVRYGNAFTYTLIDYRQRLGATAGRVLTVGAVLTGVLGAYVLATDPGLINAALRYVRKSVKKTVFNLN